MSTAAVVVAFALVATVSHTPATAASAETAAASGPRIRVADLPSVRQVAGIYPYLRGGSRDVYRNRTIDVRSRDCLYYVTGARARSGRWASYVMRNGSLPYFRGKADPTVFVYQFRSNPAARRAFFVVQRSVRRCEGTHADDFVRLTSRQVPVSRLGTARFAYREVQRGHRANPRDADYSLDVWVRQGRRLVNVRAQSDSGAPAKDRVMRLTRRGIRAVG